MSTSAEPYVPPAMPAFPVDLPEVTAIFAPYMGEKRPLDFFFEMFVLDVLGELPQPTQRALDELVSVHGIFGAAGGDWRRGLREGFQLSPTIEVAILDLWYRNSAGAAAAGWSLHPWHFAMMFLDNYFADGSHVDVWHGNALELARERIAQARRCS
jgi:hypothetical protein